jgi:iron complex outermembrane receptor protein
MKKILWLFLCLGTFHGIVAQVPCSLRLEGYLLFSDDSSVVENAEIFVEDLHIKSNTDKRGFFQLKKLCYGNILLEIDLGDQVHIHYFLDISHDTLIRLYISKPALSMHAALIRGKKNTDPGLNADQLIQNAGDGLAAQLQKIPGIQTLQTGNSIGKPVSEGMTGLRLPIYVNGIKQEGQQWGAEHSPELDVLGYSKIHVISGAHILTRSHDAMGGLVDIQGNKEAHSGEVDITNGIAYALNGRQWTAFSRASGNPYEKNYTWFANASYRRGGNYQAPDYYLHNTGLEEFGFYGGWKRSAKNTKRTFDVSYFQNTAGIFSASRIGNIADLEAAIQRSEPLYGIGKFDYEIATPKQFVRHAQARYELDKTNNKLLVAVQFDNRREYDFHRNSAKQTPHLDLHQYNFNISKDYNTVFLRHPHLQWGWSSSQTINRYGGYYFIPDFVASSTGVYALSQFKYNQWQLIFSARGDAKLLYTSWTDRGQNFNDNRSFANIAGAAEFVRFSRKGKLVLNLMRMWRAPWVNELYSRGVHHGSAAYEEGNADLRTEHDYKFQMEYHFENKRFKLYNKSYFHYINNYILLSPGNEPVLTVRGAFPAYYYRQFDAIFLGSDLHIEYKVSKHWEWRNRGSFTYGRDIQNNIFPAYIPVPFVATSVHYDHRNFTFYATCQYNWKQAFYTDSNDYIPPPPAYFILHSGASARNLLGGQNLSIYLEVNNLLNRPYRNYLDRFRYFADLPGRNIQIKMIYNFHHHNEK